MKRYESVFRMYHKLRVVIVKKDDRYTLQDSVEYDEAFVSRATSPKVKNKLKRRRGSQNQSKVAVMAESTMLEDMDSERLRSAAGILNEEDNEPGG